MTIVNVRLSHFTAVLVLLAISCNSAPSATTPGPDTPAVQVPAQSETAVEPEESDPAVTPAPTVEPAASVESDGGRPPRIKFGCEKFDPIKSQDPCSSASDCAPSFPCHAPACVFPNVTLL